MIFNAPQPALPAAMGIASTKCKLACPLYSARSIGLI